MHIIEAYALYCGLKIEKPFIHQEKVDGVEDKFILFNPHSRGEAKNYKKWQQIIDIVKPKAEEKNFKIIQVDSSEKEYSGCQKINNISFNQTAWLTNKCEFLIGIDSFCMHLASTFDKKMFILFGNHHYYNCCKPYFSSAANIYPFIVDLKNKKPTFSYERGGEDFNTIDPSLVANTIIQNI